MILYDKRQNGVYVYTHSAEPRVSKGFLIVPAVLVKQFLELRLWFLKGTKNKFESAWYLYGLCVQTELCPSQLGPKSHTRKLKAKTAKEKALMAKSILSSLRTHKSIGHQYVCRCCQKPQWPGCSLNSSESHRLAVPELTRYLSPPSINAQWHYVLLPNCKRPEEELRKPAAIS